MYKTFAELRAKRARGDNGFTLIELLVVVVILGVLIAIAIPVYLNYRKGANDAATESDVRNAISVLEVCNTGAAYPPSTGGEWSGTVTVCAGQTLSLSSGSTLKYGTNPGGVSFVLAGTNSGGANKYWCYNSAKGGSVAAIANTPVNLNNASC